MPSSADQIPPNSNEGGLLSKVVANVSPLDQLSKRVEGVVNPIFQALDARKEYQNRQILINLIFGALDKRENYLIVHKNGSKSKSSRNLSIDDVESIKLLLYHKKSNKDNLTPKGKEILQKVLSTLLPANTPLDDELVFIQHKRSIEQFIKELKQRSQHRNSKLNFASNDSDFASQIQISQAKFVSLLCKKLRSQLFIRKKSLEKTEKTPSSVSTVANILLTSFKKSINLEKIETAEQFQLISEKISTLYGTKKGNKKYQNTLGLDSKMSRRQVIASTVRLLARNELLQNQKSSSASIIPKKEIYHSPKSLQERTQKLVAQALLSGSFLIGLIAPSTAQKTTQAIREATPEIVQSGTKLIESLKDPLIKLTRPLEPFAKIAYEVMAPAINSLGSYSQDYLSRIVRERLDLKPDQKTLSPDTQVENSPQTIHELARNQALINSQLYDLYLSGEVSLDQNENLWDFQAKLAITQLSNDMVNYFLSYPKNTSIQQFLEKIDPNFNNISTILLPREAVRNALRIYLVNHPDSHVTFTKKDQIQALRNRKAIQELEAFITLPQVDLEQANHMTLSIWDTFEKQHQDYIAKKSDLEQFITTILNHHSNENLSFEDQQKLQRIIFDKKSPLIWSIDQSQSRTSPLEQDENCPLFFSPKLYEAIKAICQKLNHEKLTLQDLQDRLISSSTNLPPLTDSIAPSAVKKIAILHQESKVNGVVAQRKESINQMIPPLLNWEVIKRTLERIQFATEQKLALSTLELSESDKTSIQESLSLLLTPYLPSSKVLSDKSGNPLEITPAAGSDWRFPTTYNQLPKNLLDALVATEDGNFWSHHGLDTASAIRAASPFSQGGGASGITAQLVKLTLNSPQELAHQYESGTRMEHKKHEMLVTILYEQILKESYLQVLSAKIDIKQYQFSPEELDQQAQKLAKQEIITRYLNTVYFGRHALGVEAAAHAYFDKPAKDLTQLESITLVSFIQSPSVHPSSVENALQRRNVVLDLLYSKGLFNYLTLLEYKKEPIGWVEKSIPAFTAKNTQESHFLSHVIPEDLGPIDAEFSTPDVQTTLDINLQNILKSQLHQRLRELTENHSDLELTASAMVVDTRSGEVLSYIGNSMHETGIDWAETPVNPGSILKPLLAAWLIRDHGMKATSPLPDLPIANLPEEDFEAPVFNNAGKSYSNVTLEFALANSLNRPFVHALEKHGLISFVKFLESVGVKSIAKQLQQDPSHFSSRLILGSNQYTITMSEMAQAYQMLFNHGKSIDLKFVQGKILHKTLLHPSIAASVSAVLQNHSLSRPAFGGSLDKFPGDVAVKTGTSSPNSTGDKYYAHDNWLVAFDERTKLLFVYWLGDQNGKNLPSTTPHQQFTGSISLGPLALDMIEYTRNRLPSSIAKARAENDF